MPAPIKAITSMFLEVVREEPFFRKWRKEGSRRFWDRDREIHRGVELMLFKHSFESDQCVGLAIHLGFPTGVRPLQHGYGGEQQAGVFVATTYASPTEGMGVPTYASDRAWHLREEGDIETLRIDLRRLFGELVVPWIKQHSNEESFLAWYCKEHPMPARLPVILAKTGRQAARREFAEWLLNCPEDRGGDRLVRWLAECELLSPEMQERFRIGEMQMREVYCAEMRKIAAEILSANS